MKSSLVTTGTILKSKPRNQKSPGHFLICFLGGKATSEKEQAIWPLIP